MEALIMATARTIPPGEPDVSSLYGARGQTVLSLASEAHGSTALEKYQTKEVILKNQMGERSLAIVFQAKGAV